MFKTIVVAVDGSEFSDKAVELAAGLAKPVNAAIVLVHVTELRPSRDVAGSQVHIQDDAEGVTARHAKELEAAGLSVTTELRQVVYSNVARVIVDAAQQHDAELIVMGSRGRSDLTALIVGSVAHKVLHLSDRPVLIAR